jgi:hypothetical protein
VTDCIVCSFCFGRASISEAVRLRPHNKSDADVECPQVL